MQKCMILILVAVLTATGNTVTAEQCPKSESGGIRYRFYPSTTSGQSFIFCGDGDTLITYSCPDGFVYSPRSSLTDKSPLCMKRPDEPYAFDCSQDVNGSYSGDNTLYATCVNGGPTMVNECPKGKTFGKDTRLCEMACTEAGIFGVSDPLSDYYTCSYNSSTNTFKILTGVCPQNTKFLDDYEVCLSDDIRALSGTSTTTSEKTIDTTVSTSSSITAQYSTSTTVLSSSPIYSSTVTGSGLPDKDTTSGSATIPSNSTETPSPTEYTDTTTDIPTDSTTNNTPPATINPTAGTPSDNTMSTPNMTSQYTTSPAVLSSTLSIHPRSWGLLRLITVLQVLQQLFHLIVGKLLST